MEKQAERSSFLGLAVAGLAAVLFSACGDQSTVGGNTSGGGNNSGNFPGNGGGGGGGAGTFSLGVGGSGGNTGGTGGGTAAAAVWPPDGFINVTNSTTGAYALGPEISGNTGPAAGDSGGDSASGCVGLFGVVRDFKMGNQTGGHPDFETAPTGLDTGIVAATLDSDGKPTYASATGKTSSTTSKDNFDQWYRDVQDVNRTFVLGLHLVSLNGISTFAAVKPSSFFPLDGQGFGNEGQNHNFAFTTEIHTAFKYAGGETFAFVGDDDVWVFIDKKLVIDLGGRHAQTNKSVAIDSLGLTIGQTYELAVFHAERHTSESNFQIQTTLSFTDCGQVNGVIY
jgi:fibro-slime domain-containing protein